MPRYLSFPGKRRRDQENVAAEIYTRECSRGAVFSSTKSGLSLFFSDCFFTIELCEIKRNFFFTVLGEQKKFWEVARDDYNVMR